MLLLFAVATAFSLAAVERARDVERDVARLEELRRSVDAASVLMREQYIHQAHTLIAWDESHLDHYGEVAERARQAVDALRPEVAADDLALVDRMAAVTAESDRAFLNETVPQVRAGDRDKARELHEAMEREVVAFAALAGQLHDRIEARVSSAQVRSEDAWRDARRVALGCLGTAAVAALTLGVLLTRSLTRKLGRLQAGAARLGNGDLSARISLEPNDEFARVAATINEMAAALDERERALLRANRLAAIGQVAAGVAHELNNPLGVIAGWVALLKRAGSADAEAVAAIEEETAIARDIVQGLLDLARPSALRLDDVDLVQLAKEGAQRLKQLPELAGVEVEARVGVGPVLVRGDEGRLRQVVLNLMKNAAEASPEGVGIEVRVGVRDQRAELSVRDRGPGFPEEPERALDPFFTTKPNGVGLGLAIVQAVVEAHGGAITLGRAAGGGAEVKVELPLVTTGGVSA